VLVPGASQGETCRSTRLHENSAQIFEAAPTITTLLPQSARSDGVRLVVEALVGGAGAGLVLTCGHRLSSLVISPVLGVCWVLWAWPRGWRSEVWQPPFQVADVVSAMRGRVVCLTKLTFGDGVCAVPVMFPVGGG
jgi:hypothetical protein